jgi:histone H3/H4
MISLIKVKNIAGKKGKKLSKKAFKKIECLLENKSEEILNRAVRSANLAGRMVIREEDIV